jgi:tetratricopeptide (TPR) repeat protein
MSIPSRREVSAEVETICRSMVLLRSKRAAQLLRYLVEAALQRAPKEAMKETVIGVEVFGRPGNYDPKKDAIVRVSVAELRERLATYYETEGRRDLIRIRIPQGAYVPVIYHEPAIAALNLNDRAAMCVANARVALGRRTLQGYEAAMKYLDMALEENVEHPRLLSLKAMVHAGQAMYGKHPRTELEAAESLLERAKKESHEFWELPLVEAWIKATLYFDWAAAEALFRHALKLSHDEARFNTWYTAFLASQLRCDESLEILNEAVSHAADDAAFLRGDLALMQIITGRYEEAEETLRSTFELLPKAHYLAYMHLAILHEARGNFAEAAEAIEKVPVTAEESTIVVGLRPLMIGLAGNRVGARKLYEGLLKVRRSGRQFVPASQLANAAIGVGDFDAATAWFVDSAIIERDPIMSWVAILPFERHLRHHPDFRSLVTKTMKLSFPHEQSIPSKTS